MAELGAKELAIVRGAPLFQRLPERTLAIMLAGSSPRQASRGATLFLQDEPADRFYLVLDGWVKLYRITPGGVESVINVVAPGETFAEAAMFASAKFPVTAEAATDCRVISITRAAFTRALESDPGAVMAILASLSMRLRFHVHHIEQLQVLSTAQRVGDFLLRFCPPGPGNAVFELPFDKSLIARRLGMKPETFSRALAKLRAVGIETHGATVSVEDLERLRAFCQEGGEEA
jgi:CRP/FNR family transcriptional regulator, dissimilatory nitrate respiration regulator